jgi:Zn-dependent peptidase ImmA (M78 family)/transcriptional regulator with XRE-family HTH domain
MTRVEVKPALLRWARERAGFEASALKKRFPRLEDWEEGKSQPTLKQIEKLAKATHAPVGFFFLSAPPIERLPLPDFRTMGSIPIRRPSPNLLDMVYVCQERQAWYREFAQATGELPRAFVGKARVTDSVETTATEMRHALGFDIEERRSCPTWADALRRFISQAEEMGVLVMCSGVVLNNNTRPLDPEEFRGFAIADDLAPLVFINGADTKSAQMFTLAHEFAHIWLGQSGISNATITSVPDLDAERWCNQVAAELLVPLAHLRRELRSGVQLEDEVTRLARVYKVGNLVILRRLYDAAGLSRAAFIGAYEAELHRLREIAKGSGGNFYLTQAARASKRFTRALVVSALEGQTLYRDALRMLGISKVETFHELGRSVQVM